MNRIFKNLVVFVVMILPLTAFSEGDPWDHHFVKMSDGANLHYVTMGKGTPIILLHGAGGSGEGNWMRNGIGPALAKTNLVIALDQRGHAYTDAGDRSKMTQDVLELMNHLGIEKAHIGGYSMGGATTSGLLKIAPERFITASVMGIGIKETEEWLGKTPQDPAMARRQVANEGNNTPRIDLTARADGAPRGAPKGAPEPNPEVDLTKIHFPVLALNGGNDRPLAKTHRMWRELRDFTYVVIPGRNHMEACRDPLFGDALVRFITANNP